MKTKHTKGQVPRWAIIAARRKFRREGSFIYGPLTLRAEARAITAARAALEKAGRGVEGGGE